MEKLLNSISRYLDVEPGDMLDHIKALPQPQDLSDLQARVDCLLRENGELKAKAKEGDLLRKEVGELKNRIKAVEKEVKTAKAERDKCRSTKTQVVPSSVLNRTKHHQSNPSNVPGILYSSLPKRSCIYASKFLITRSNRIPSL